MTFYNLKKTFQKQQHIKVKRLKCKDLKCCIKEKPLYNQRLKKLFL